MSEWTSVNDRLPEQFESVIGYMPTEMPSMQVHECFRAGENWKSVYIIDDYGKMPSLPVSHWMPLPEPPEVTK